MSNKITKGNTFYFDLHYSIRLSLNINALMKFSLKIRDINIKRMSGLFSY